MEQEQQQQQQQQQQQPQQEQSNGALEARVQALELQIRNLASTQSSSPETRPTEVVEQKQIETPNLFEGVE